MYTYSPFVYYTTAPVCGVPQSAYLPQINGTLLDFTKSAIYQYNSTDHGSAFEVGLPDLKSWAYGAYRGGVALSYNTSGGSSVGCPTGISRSAQVLLVCFPFADISGFTETKPCHCKCYSCIIIIFIFYSI